MYIDGDAVPLVPSEIKTKSTATTKQSLWWAVTLGRGAYSRIADRFLS